MKKQTDIDIAELILKMQQQLSLLDKKIDTLIGQSQEKPFNAERPKPFQRFDHSHHRSERRQDNNYRERALHKAICADCNKECEVPFRPSQDRPVYCRDCFSKRKRGGSFRGKADNIDKPQGGENRGGRENRGFGKGNKPIFRRRKERV